MSCGPGLYAFDLTQKRARRPAGAPDRKLARSVGLVGIVGAGLMAVQLALLCAQRLQVPVVLTDIDPDRLTAGVAEVHRGIAALAAKGRIDADRARRLTAAVTGAATPAGLAAADLVIEAVVEDVEVKRQVFAELEAVVSPDCVLASNTSALGIADLAAGLDRPDRVLGLHFFNPVAVLPLVEVIRGPETGDPAVATALAVVADLRKSAVLVRDAPGFVVNRVLTRLLGAVLAAIDEGTPIELADRALAPVGLPMSPLALLQLVGPPVALHVSETLAGHFPDRYAVSVGLQRIVTAGLPGVYGQDASGRPEIAASTRELIGAGDEASTEAQVRDRALEAVADEIAHLLAERVVSGPADVDLCLLLGAGFPFHDGGITPYLDRTGVTERVLGRRFLPPGVASVPDRST